MDYSFLSSFCIKFFLVIFVIFSLFFSLFFFWVIYYKKKEHLSRKKGEYKYVGYGFFLRKIFIEFPRQFAYDWLTKDPDEFRDFGFHMICGQQGKGKTITLVYLLLRYQKMYPKLVVKTNMSYKYEDGQINDWRDLLNSNNGIYGEVDVLDEVQNWFSSNQSKDFPPSMLEEITQQRKQRKIIIGTSQVFTRVAKPIRENVYMLYEPVTLFGCITIVRKYLPIVSADGSAMDKKKPKGMFFFVHNKEIRNAFDTYKKIQKLKESGFIDRSKQFNTVQVTNVKVLD